MNFLLFFLDASDNICNKADVLKIFYFGKQLIKFAFEVIPIVAIIILSFDLLKNVISNSESDMKKNFSIFVRRIIFMVIVFLIPNIVGVMATLVENSLGISKSEYVKCINVTDVTLRMHVLAEKAKCTSLGNDWDAKTETCNTKITASETAKKIVRDLKDFNSSREKYKYSTSNILNTSINLGKYPIAATALSMAYPSEAQATGDYGTELYVYAYDHVIGDFSDYRTGKKQESSSGTTRYRSCSEAVTVFVRYSGVDDDFGSKGTHPQGLLNYVSSSSKWQQVNWNGDFSKLQPGDVFVDKDHALLYVGEKLLHEYFPKAPQNYNIVQASYSEDYIHSAKSPYVMYNDKLASSRWVNNAFRCIKPDKNSKYAKYRK